MALAHVRVGRMPPRTRRPVDDWLFTAALWDEEGRLLVGRLDPHPPANSPAEARLHLRGTLDEPQMLIEAPMNQEAPIFRIESGDGAVEGQARLTVDGSGTTILGSSDEPRGIVIHDTATGIPYLVTVTNGALTIAPSGGR